MLISAECSDPSVRGFTIVYIIMYVDLSYCCMYLQVYEELSKDGAVTSNIVVACFLVREGADWSIKNKKGVSPKEILPPHMASLISTYVASQ